MLQCKLLTLEMQQNKLSGKPNCTKQHKIHHRMSTCTFLKQWTSGIDPDPDPVRPICCKGGCVMHYPHAIFVSFRYARHFINAK